MADLNLATGIVYAPHLPMAVLWLLGVIALGVVGASIFVRAHGSWARALGFAIVLAALANPLIVHETREPLSDVVALVMDRTQSQDIGMRRADAERALSAMR